LRKKKLFEQNNKYYFADHGLRNLLCGFNVRGSIEKIIENVIYLHLLAQGFKVTVGIFRSTEIGFVAKRGDKTIYIQATYLLGSEETIKREFGNLQAIKDNFPKYVISMDPVGGDLPQYPGIRHMHLREFLKKEL
jgi:predicted AAA+ superfamily ATPase